MKNILYYLGIILLSLQVCNSSQACDRFNRTVYVVYQPQRLYSQPIYMVQNVVVYNYQYVPVVVRVPVVVERIEYRGVGQFYNNVRYFYAAPSYGYQNYMRGYNY